MARSVKLSWFSDHFLLAPTWESEDPHGSKEFPRLVDLVSDDPWIFKLDSQNEKKINLKIREFENPTGFEEPENFWTRESEASVDCRI